MTLVDNWRAAFVMNMVFLVGAASCGGRTEPDALNTGWAGWTESDGAPSSRAGASAGGGFNWSGAPASGTGAASGASSAGGLAAIGGTAGHSAGESRNACQACFESDCAELIASCDGTARCREGLACVADRCEYGSFDCVLACFSDNPAANVVAFEMLACIIGSCPAGCAGL